MTIIIDGSGNFWLDFIDKEIIPAIVSPEAIRKWRDEFPNQKYKCVIIDDIIEQLVFQKAIELDKKRALAKSKISKGIESIGYTTFKHYLENRLLDIGFEHVDNYLRFDTSKSPNFSKKLPQSIKKGKFFPVNDHTLKIERATAKAMIEGFWCNNSKHYITIYAAHKNSWSLKNNFARLPKLITLMNNINVKYELSECGKRLHADDYNINLCYIAVLHSIFYIRNDIKMWEDLCSSGFFDIWNCRSPFNCLLDDKDHTKNKPNPCILLLRIYEVNDDFKYQIKFREHFDYIRDPQPVRIKQAIIKNSEFKKLEERLKQLTDDYLEDILLFNNTLNYSD